MYSILQTQLLSTWQVGAQNISARAAALREEATGRYLQLSPAPGEVQ